MSYVRFETVLGWAVFAVVVGEVWHGLALMFGTLFTPVMRAFGG